MSDSSNDLNVGRNEPSNTLGLGWQTQDDCLCFSIGTSVPSGNTESEMLSVICQVFDPLRLLAPVLINMKMLLQQVRLHRLPWDEALPQDIVETWVSISQCLNMLKHIRVPRRVVIKPREHIALAFMVEP